MMWRRIAGQIARVCRRRPAPVAEPVPASPILLQEEDAARGPLPDAAPQPTPIPAQEAPVMSVKRPMTPGRLIAAQRRSILAKVRRQKKKAERVLSRYDLPVITDAQIKALIAESIALIDEVDAFIATAPARYNARPGGLGK